MNRSALRSVLVALLALLAVAGASAQGTAGPKRYARVADAGGRLRNLADEKGVVIATPEKGTLVAVYEEIPSGWSAVEIPGGFPVWIYGRYTKRTEVPDIYEITRNAVNLRPGPSSDVANFPLPQRLQAGDRVQAIEISDTTIPLDEAWVRVWSPPGVRAWIATSSLAALGADENGPGLWSESLKSAARVAVLPVDRPAQAADPLAKQGTAAAAGAPIAAAAKTEADAAARADLDAARELLKNERAKATPDYPSVRRALEGVLVKAPSGAVAIEARNELRLLDALEQAASLENELARERAHRAERAVEEQKKVWERSRAKDPLGDAFLARGILSREQGVDGHARYWISFGGKRVAEVQCTSGRYALDLYNGFEIGVSGIEIEGSEPASGTMRIELTKLEVIARR